LGLLCFRRPITFFARSARGGVGANSTGDGQRESIGDAFLNCSGVARFSSDRKAEEEFVADERIYVEV